MFSVKILKDSLAPCNARLTTWELTYPRFVHAELLTHRVFSKNSASSRAIPVTKMMARVKNDPAMPVFWGANQSGMQAEKELVPEKKSKAFEVWLEARDLMLTKAQELLDLGLHKQITNRVLEPWMNITIILTSTHFKNFLALRNHPDAQPEIAFVAKQMYETYKTSVPDKLNEGDWHLPLLEDKDALIAAGYSHDDLLRICTGRCARVSYLTHDGRKDPAEDIGLCQKLLDSGHMSPFEHAAQALSVREYHGNFIGWKQYRKMIPNESIYTHNHYCDLEFLVD